MTMEVAVTVGCVLFVLLVLLICLGCVARHSINQKCAKRANQRAGIVSKAGQLHSTVKDANLTIVPSLCKDSADKTETKDPPKVKTEVTPLLQHQKISAPKAMEKTPSTEPSTSDEAQRQSARQASSTVLSTVRRQSSGLYNNIGNIQPELYLRRGSVLTQISGSDYAVGTIRLKLSYDNSRSDFVVRLIEISLESSTVTKCRVGACLLNGAAQTAPRFIETAAAKGNFTFEEPLKFPIPIDELMRRKLRLEIFGLEPQKIFIGIVELDLLVNDPSADIEVTAEIERRPDAAVITSAEQGNNGELEVRLKYMSSINRLIVTLLQAKNMICDKDASAAEVWIKVKVWQGDRVFKKKKTAAVRFSNPLVLNQALTFNLCEQSVQSLAVEIVLFHGHQWKMTNNLIGRTVLMAATKVLLVVSVIWLLMGGSAEGGCPVSSTWDNYGGRKLDDGGCLTVVDMFEVKKFYGQVTIDDLHRFCARSFKGGKLLSFTDSQKLQMLDGVNFKQAVASNILIHPGVRIFETNITMKQNVHVEKCGQTERLSCDGYPYEYISNGNGTVDGMLFKCAEKGCCNNTDCDERVSVLTYESTLLANFPDLSHGNYCRCLLLNSTFLTWNLSNDHIYDCDDMKCDVFICQNDEYTDCNETRVQTCTYLSDVEDCKEFTYEVISEKEHPYGRDCEERDYGESCLCPCAGTWTEWSIASETCGKVVFNRYRPTLDMVSEDESCDGAEDLCCKETKEDFVVCDHYKYTMIEYETFKEKCERHNGQVKASETELVCVCLSDEQFGEFCERFADLCSERKWCLNGGTCRNYKGNYKCHCTNGFSGMNCTDVVEVCQSNEHCHNDGVCVLLESGSVCECSDQFFGTNCELKIGSCEKAVCQNNATCLQVTNNAYRCNCSYKFEGMFCEKELTIVQIYIRLITNSLALKMAIIIIVLIIIVCGCFLLIMAIRGHHIRKETSFERVLRTGLQKRKAAIAEYDAKHKFGNEKGKTQKSSSSAVGQEMHSGKFRIWNKSPVRSSDSEAASCSRKKSKSKKARASHRDESRRRKLKGRKSRSRRSRSHSNSRHRSRSRSLSNSASRRV